MIALTSLLGLCALLLVVGSLLKSIVATKGHPFAPGAFIGRYSQLWYIYKVWKGQFETWNIEQHHSHGKIIRVAPDMYSIDDPEAVKQIYGISTNMPKSEWYLSFSDPRVSNHNLFSTIDRQFHTRMRRAVGNMYAMTSIKSYEPYVNECVSILLRQFDAFATTGQMFDLQRWMQCYAFDVIGEITFSTRVGFMESGGKDINGIMGNLEKSNSFSTLAGVNKLLLPILFLCYGNPTKGLFDWSGKLIQARRDLVAEKKLNRSAEDFYGKVESFREKDPEGFEQYRVKNALIGNITAGSDTTSIALTATLYYLAKSPEIMDKVRKEIVAGIASGVVSTPITFEQAQNLSYLQFVIKEAMRLHPSTGLPMWRVVQEPGETIAGKFFPAGAIVGINSWVAHRNKTVFGADTHEFRPERWDPAVTSPEKLSQMERYYLPFGAGTRTCIGKNISILEMSKLIPELVRRYDMTLISKELQYENHWFVKQKDVMVSISKIN